MATVYRKSVGWRQLAMVCVVSSIIMVVDARTKWLHGPRNVLSVAASPIQFLASLPTRVGRFFSDTLSAETDTTVAYQNLRNEYFKLKSEALLMRSLTEENKELRALLNAAPRLEEEMALAALVNVSIDPNNHSILVGRGLRHGVYSGQAVVDDLGVVGQVTEVMPFNSSVLLITDPGHALPVQVQRTGLRTVVYGTGNLETLRVPFLNQNADILEGDILLSSGLGGRFPNGYPVATITKVEVIEDAAFMRVDSEPIAKLDRADHVLILSRTKPSHEQPAELKLLEEVETVSETQALFEPNTDASADAPSEEAQ